MGAAAFLMVEYVGIPYVDVIKHAILPALISYIALLYIVHLEAVKADMQGLPRPGVPRPWMQKVVGVLFGFIGTAAVAGAVYYGIGWIKPTFGDAAPWIVAVLLGGVYVGLIGFGARYPDLELDDPDSPVVSLPEVGPTVKTGLHFILPVIVLVWCLMVEQLSPGLSAFWATVLMMFILVTQRPLAALFRGQDRFAAEVRRGFRELLDGLISGARNMIGIGIATATAGVIVGAVSQTGVGLVLADLVEVLSLGNVMLMLILTAVLSLILGMGLPTTANYIVVSSLMAPVVVALGEQSGLIVPLIAVHLFVFYFGIMADVTPPVGLASFAAAAVSGGDPIRTGLIAFGYSMRTAALPFLFIFNTDLLLIDVDFLHGVLIFVVSTVAMLIFAAATQGWFLVRCRVHEVVLLLLIAFTLFRPGFWMDRLIAPFEDVDPSGIEKAAGRLAAGSDLRLRIAGTDGVGNPREFVAVLALPAGASGKERLTAAGLEMATIGGDVVVDAVAFGSAAEKAGFEFDQKVLEVHLPTQQPAKEWLWIPALVVLGLVAWLQSRRRPAASPAAASSCSKRTARI
jgi:TRAP transporter 4TM/12TM fusion protein